MKPTSACNWAFLWLLHHVILVRSRSSSVSRVQQLRGRVAPLQPVALSSSSKEIGHDPKDVKTNSKPPEAGKPGKGKDKPRKGKGHETDADTLTHEVVDQATTLPHKKKFDSVDANGDGKISYSEYLASTGASRKVAAYRFNCSDDNLDSSLDMKEFSEADQHPKDIERCVGMLLAFRMVDTDRDGELTQEELWGNAHGQSFDAQWAFMIACSDLNGDGKVSPKEFSTDMYGCMEDKSDKAYVNFADFNKTDVDKNGCANETEMDQAVNQLFGHSLISKRPPNRATRGLSRRWMSCVDFDSNRCLTKKEYDGLLSPTPRQSQCIGKSYNQYESDMDFELMDTNSDGKVSEQEYYTWCGKLDIEIDQKEADALFQSADVDKDGFITEEEFDAAGEEHKGDGRGVLFFIRSTDPARSPKSRTEWRGTLKKTWAGVFRSSA